MTTNDIIKLMAGRKWTGKESMLRTRIRTRGTYCRCCPITFACWKTTRKFFTSNDWASAADKIGLPYGEGYNIVDAADSTWIPTGGKLYGLRNRMLRAAKLK